MEGEVKFPVAKGRKSLYTPLGTSTSTSTATFAAYSDIELTHYSAGSIQRWQHNSAGTYTLPLTLTALI